MGSLTLTTWVNGDCIDLARFIDDPFVYQKIYISWKDRIRGLFHWKFEVTFMVNGSPTLIERIMEVINETESDTFDR